MVVWICVVRCGGPNLKSLWVVLWWCKCSITSMDGNEFSTKPVRRILIEASWSRPVHVMQRRELPCGRLAKSVITFFSRNVKPKQSLPEWLLHRYIQYEIEISNQKLKIVGGAWLWSWQLTTPASLLCGWKQILSSRIKLKSCRIARTVSQGNYLNISLKH